MARKKQSRDDDSGGLFRFVDVATFGHDWKSLGFGDDELRILETGLCRDPLRWPVVPVVGGVRKLRMADPSSRKGKRGGCRVLYAHLAGKGVILLIAAWLKSEKEDLPPQDYRALGQLVERYRSLVATGKIR